MSWRAMHCDHRRTTRQAAKRLSGMFKGILTELHQALTKNQLQLLMKCVLPVLVVTGSLLTVSELVWATGAEVSQVRCFTLTSL